MKSKRKRNQVVHWECGHERSSNFWMN